MPFVSSLSIAPVKSFMRSMDAVRVESHGAVGDREFVVVDEGGTVTSLFRTGAFAGCRAEVDHEMSMGVGGTLPHAEDGWDGLRVRVGDAVLEVGGPVPRCAAVTRDPDTGERDMPLVRTIRGYRGTCDTVIGPGVPFGVYARAVEPRTIRVGDTLDVVAPWRPPRPAGDPERPGPRARSARPAGPTPAAGSRGGPGG